MTLSHCWGDLNIFRLLKENLGALQKGIPYENLCRTFQDAISIARNLGGMLLFPEYCHAISAEA